MRRRLSAPEAGQCKVSPVRRTVPPMTSVAVTTTSSLDRVLLRRSADLRYAGQNYELEVAWTGDLDGMIQRRLIRVATTYNRTNYFIDRGQQRGAVLARLDDSMLRLKEQDDLANLRRIEAQLDFARKQEQRYQELVRQNTIAATQLDLTRSERQVLEQDLARARVTVARTRQERDYAVVRAPFGHTGYNRWTDPDGYPAVKPPWGTLTSIDLQRGDIAWQVPLGDVPGARKPDAPETGTENYGGPVVTASGLAR